MDHDVLVIGGGSAGYAAARTAESLGARTAVVDSGPLGGLCILRGCMPTKAILRSSDVAALLRRAPEFGLRPVLAEADLSVIIDRKNRLVREFADYRIDQLKRFPLYEQPASFISPHEVLVGERVVSARNFIIATGSEVAEFPIPGLAEAGYLTSDHALEMREPPTSMIVLGGGPVALEFAQFYQRVGVRVSLIQRSAHVLSLGDEDLARPLEARLRAEGMQVFTGTRVLRAERNGAGRSVYFEHEGGEKRVTADVILMALGRRPRIGKLNLEAAGVKTEDGRVLVDATMRTSQPHIFAAGDVSGLQEVVHIAIQQGEIAAFNAVHPDRPAKTMDERLSASVVFSDPAVAGVGLSEKDCRRMGIDYLAASYPFGDHGKSMCLGETHGHVKLICLPGSGEIIGAHIVGPEAGELIHELICLMYFRGTVFDLARIPHYHPTLAEILTYPAEELADKISSEH
jgi:pyruvate/2-oxoglutarate dehydrogenase complex dihydrolipoamide dehydrogenase (E3) component